ncbi:unnamed protein product [Cylindrotheca closterium]|uniref:Purine permease n=1 Tax=Cylindrotheca closterium TaxID=2856 RepID=A0AAD2FS03_9STRA|nr:unnamed protein product [Cylindrotheca closterium]CAJ1951326.1 unnamed protein product [Cylindrotheca closterium]
MSTEEQEKPTTTEEELPIEGKPMSFRDSFMGEKGKYDYGALCMPNIPFCGKPNQQVNFYGRDEPIPIFLALIMGLQHCFAMVGGLITPPLVVFRFTVCGFPFCADLEQYAISAALITSGFCSIFNVAQFAIPFSEKITGKAYYVGSGVLSVLGTSFTFLPIYEIAIAQMKQDGMSGEAAYGAMLGTSMVCCLLELFLSFMPIRIIKKIFPPIVTSITVILIGVALTGTGMKYWGGGVVCAEMGWQTHASIVAQDLSFGPPFPTCTAGETSYMYGDPRYIGLGFSVLAFLVVIEMWGSVFMKNCNVLLALLFGYMIAGLAPEKYVAQDNIELAEPITFLWVYTFPISVYAPAIIPMLIAYLVTTVETVGDITAVYEASLLDTNTEEYNDSIQGGLTADGVMSIVSALFTSMPNTTFSQNNGVIALTKCASRRAGYACAFWLIFFGVLSKVAGVITSIPDCVLGGMTIFLFANVLASGIKLASEVDLQHSRRNRFILAFSLALGVGVTVWPYAFMDRRASPYTAAFWPCADCNNTMKGLRNGVSIFLSTGYCVGTVVAMILNGILPADAEIIYFDEKHKNTADEKKASDEPEDETAA